MPSLFIILPVIVPTNAPVPVPTLVPCHPGQKHLADHGGHLCQLSLLQLNEVKYVTSQNKPPQTASQENNKNHFVRNTRVDARSKRIWQRLAN